jgi:8-oxo-dGTP diphosphatase
MLIFAVRLIVEKDGRLLFLHQTKQNGGGFSLVGGNVEEREFAREALSREAKEEAGISIDPTDLVLVHVLHRHKLKKNEQSLVLYFKAHHFEGEPESLERKKFRDVVWLPIASLPDNISKATRHVLASMSSGEIYSEFPSRKKVLTFWEQSPESWSARLPDY